MSTGAQTGQQMRFYCGSCDFFVSLGSTEPSGECHFFPIEADGRWPRCKPREYACSKHQGYARGEKDER